MIRNRSLTIALLAFLAFADALPAQGPSPEAIEFFEKKVRPVLAEQCYKCHSDTKKAHKGGLRLDSRAALLQGGDSGPAVVPGHPEKSRLIEAVRYSNPDLQMPPKARLPAAVLADLERWVKLGAPWPAETASGTTRRDTIDLEQRRREHWAWAPVRPVAPPTVRDTSWPAGPVDRFLLARLEEKGLMPAPPADRATLLRRLHFDLVGLPPTPEEIDAFLADTSADAVARVVDRLLASRSFGERWARHGLDLVRYGETRGHEFDAPIPHAWQYRDYLIRALNADVPYDQLVREHIAGDLLERPRLHPTAGFNESVLGTGFWFLGEEVHSPVDIRQDQADRLDNRIDVLTKAFLGLTVACARCHDHKFDALTQKDYYALFGILEGASYRQVPFETLEQHRRLAEELARLRQKAGEELRRLVPARPENAVPAPPGVVVDFGRDAWTQDGFAFRTVRAGDVLVDGEPAKPHLRVAERSAAVYDRAWDVLKPPANAEKEPGALGNIPQRPGRTLRTPAFPITTGRLYYLVRGGGAAYAAVGLHTLIAGPLHGGLVQSFPAGDDYRWVAHDLTRYRGLSTHIEFTPAPGADFAVALVVQSDTPPPALPRSGPPIEASPEALAAAQRLLTEEKALTARIRPESHLSPGLLEGNAVEERVFLRGSPKSLGEPVPRCFLEALTGPRPFATAGSGRRELAEVMTSPTRNPFLARVAVNRIWHHLFGRGLVASVDNFGVLGEKPTHPELLDDLADRFVRLGWSQKALIRELVLSRAYAMSSQPSPDAEKVDPQNLLLHRARLRRLEGEAIRDAMLTVSGRLDRTTYGPPVPIYLTPFLDGRGRPGSGPLDGNGRRSVYLAVKRNFLSPFLLAFDTPTPFSTVGRRSVSNVPAQALILLNDPFVHQQAEVWARRELAEGGSAEDRVRRMYRRAFGRPPTTEEMAACLAFVEQQARSPGRGADDLRAWADLAHMLFNVKEFIYLG